MATTTIQTVIDRAASDPDFLKRLAQNPDGTLQAEGYQISPHEVRDLLDMPNASDQELAEALQSRLSHSSGGGIGGGASGLTTTFP